MKPEVGTEFGMKLKDFNSIYKKVGGNEGDKCHYPTRLDTYGCGCQHDCSYCVSPETPILMLDGTSKPMRDIEIGDEIYGVDKRENYTYYVPSKVLAKWSVNKKAYRITLNDGREIVCSDNHRWLTRRGWKETKDLTANLQIRGLDGYSGVLFKMSDEYRKGYLRGIILGDGTLKEYHYDFEKRGRVDDQYQFKLIMKGIPAVQRCKEYLAYFGVQTNDYTQKFRNSEQIWEDVWGIRVNSRQAYDKIHELIEVMDNDDFKCGFLAGMYDSEGCRQRSIKRMANTDYELIREYEGYMSHFNFKFVEEPGLTDIGTPIWNVRHLGGISEFIRFVEITNPALKDKWDITETAIKNEHPDNLRVKSIEEIGEMELIDITTSTENFIANGCVAHNCYAKSLLDFRELWNPRKPAVADINAIRKQISKIKKGTVVRLGGMTDCFQPMEQVVRNTFYTIQELNKRKIPYLIVTKSAMVAQPEYLQILKKDLAHIQITVTTFDDDLCKTYEKASPPSKRIQAIETLHANGYDVQLRLSPFIPQYIDFDKLSDVKCDRIVVEFLRVNTWIKKWFNIDYDEYSLTENGYQHLPLERKKHYISLIKNKQISVCEDQSEAYEYWNNHFNPNPNDCCNLLFKEC